MSDRASEPGLEQLLLREPDRWALFIDFDGTLVDIAERPQAVQVEPGLPDRLVRLGRCLEGALAVVTGRPIATIDGFLAPARIDVAGLHGVELRMGNIFSPCDPSRHPDLRREVEHLKARLGREPGIIVEDKGCSVAVHWRLADPARTELAREAIEAAAAALAHGYRLQHGKKVAEILPARASKGAVIEDLLKSPPYRGRRPIFVGDDLTDEHGFAVVNARGGASVKVGDGPTEARFRLPGPAAFRDLLRLWADGADTA